MVADRDAERLTVEQWRELERTSEVKHEYVDGHIFAMAGGSGAHSRIATNITTLLDNILGDGPCIAYNSDLATRLSETRYTYADVVVSCSPHDAATRDMTEVIEPTIVFEVLSDSTEAKDRGRKSDDYRKCPTLREYVLIGTRYQRVEVYRRTEDGWGLFRFYGPQDEIELTSIQAQLPVASLYRRTDVPDQPPE
jgi:Uma2 family endonuclease